MDYIPQVNNNEATTLMFVNDLRCLVVNFLIFIFKIDKKYINTETETELEITDQMNKQTKTIYTFLIRQ